MYHFFAEHENIFDDYIDIKGGDVNHIKNVLRLKKGDEILISSGDNYDYNCIIDTITDDYVRSLITSVNEKGNELSSKVYLFQGLPKEMYEISQKITFMPLYAMMDVPISLKNVKFSLEGNYALPIRITGGDVNIIRGQEETLLVLEQRVNTKALRISTSGSGSGSEDDKMFPNDFKVDQWTMEVMVNRASYKSNNRSICGTKLVANAGPMDEIYTRFGDVTINPNQLQIKTGSSQIDVPADKFSAQPDTWYMLAFVYDGQKNYVYVNGVLVADREIRTGPYGLIGFWIGGSNELIREVRFWKTARTSQEIASNIWKMVNPDDDNLLLYYPLNGKKRDSATGEITEDETLLWDWSKNGKNLPKPSSYSFDDNKGNGFIFPPQE